MASSQACKFLKTLVVSQTSSKQTGTLIFLHGSGDSGIGIRMWIRDILGDDLKFPHLKVIIPTSHLRPYSLNQGQPSTVWFDRHEINPFSPESPDESIRESAEYLNHIIDEEVQSGIPENRIILGGLSMGGGMALHMGLRFRRNLAGIFALSSFLNHDSHVFRTLKKRPAMLPPLFQAHGHADDLVLFEWGKDTADRLKQLGVECVFHEYKTLGHEMNKDELLKLKKWIIQRVPP